MTLTNEDAEKIKKHLLNQLTNFPEEKQEQIKEQINSMTAEQVEKFVEQNKLTHLNGECIFCSITKGESKSYKIAENDSDIAILEINPLSKGHSLIVPLEHENGISESTKNLAKEVSEKIKEKFNPKTIDSKEIKIMDHSLIELIPIYGGETEKKQATEEELQSLQEEMAEENINEIEEDVDEVKEDVDEVKEDVDEVKEDIPKLGPRIP